MSDRHPSKVSAQLATDPISGGGWRSQSVDARGGRMFGGTLAAQMLSAARSATIGPPNTSSFDIRFVLPADGGVPVDFEVEGVQDGRSSAVRRVTASQHGQTVAIGSVGFHTPRDGWSHGGKPPSEHPESLPRTGSPHRSRAVTPDDFDIRYVDAEDGGHLLRRLWFRTTGGLSDSVAVHEAVTLLVSDLYFYELACLQHGYQGNDRSIRYGTTQHTVWFHNFARADEWLLLESRSPAFAGGRALVHGEVRTTDGSVVATVVQEVAIRRVNTNDGSAG